MPDNDDQQREHRFRSLYTEHYRGVQAYAVRRVPSPADVADVVADVFTVAWRRLPEIPGPPADRLWLYGVARRVVAGRHRSARRHRQLTARLAASHPARQPPGPAEAEAEAGAGAEAGASAFTAGPTAAASPAAERLAGALATLRPADREALLLVLWEELSHAEAGQVLGCSANAVAIRVHRAKARLRAALTAPGPGIPQARRPSAAAEPNRT